MKKAAVFLLVLIVASLVGVWWWNDNLRPVKSFGEKQTFVIERGDGVREIAKKLKDQNLIKNQITFFLLVKKMGIEKNIQAGSYQISPALGSSEIASRLTTGTEDFWVTIPEGWRLEEVVSYLESRGIKDSSPAGKPAVDGRFFPDTYLVPKEISLSSFLDLMRENYTKKVPPSVTNQQLIIASMVEREARTETDRPYVASVIYNRLNDKMALDIDATIQYALGRQADGSWWKKELILEDLKIKSPYNTYTNPGLPPGPICSPGLSAIMAAINPAKSDYYFYISDHVGKMHFAKNLTEHNQNIARYLEN